MNKGKINVFFLAIFLIIVITVPGLANQLTITEALELALENNLQLKQSDLDLDQAQVTLDKAYRNLLPKVSLQSTYTRLEEGVPTPTGKYIRIPTEHTIPITIPGSGEVIIPIFATIPEMESGSANMYNTKISLQQPLFTGTKTKLGIDMAKTSVLLAEIQQQQTTSQVLYNVIQAYYNLIMAEKMLKIQENALKLLDEHQRIAQVNYEAKLALKSDLLQIEIERAKALQGLKSSQNGVHLARRQLAQLLGLDEVDFQVSKPSLKPVVQEELEYLLEIAAKERPELQIFDLNLQVMANNLKMEKRFFWPNLILMGNYDWQDTEFSFEDGSWSISLVASMQLFDGGMAVKNQEELQLQMEKIVKSKENLSDLIKLEVEEAFLKLEEARVGLELQAMSLKDAEDNLRFANERYKAGVGSNLDVLNAQTLWEQTEVGLAQSEIQHQLSQIKVIYKTGFLIDYCQEVIESEE